MRSCSLAAWSVTCLSWCWLFETSLDAITAFISKPAANALVIFHVTMQIPDRSNSVRRESLWPTAQSSMLAKVWQADQFTSRDRKWRKGMPGLGGSLLSPSYSICPTPNCELMPHTHVRVFHSQWTHSGDGSTKDTSKNVTSLQSRWQWRLTTASSHKQSLRIFISFLSLPFWVSPKVACSLDVYEHLFICYSFKQNKQGNRKLSFHQCGLSHPCLWSWELGEKGIKELTLTILNTFACAGRRERNSKVKLL